MCGIAGFVDASSRYAGAEIERLSRRMGQRLVHRGPDSGGVWVDEGVGVGLSHRRLAILDLSPEGAQPMRSERGRFVVTYNGEIYNHGALRDELLALGHAFRGHSDTEVLLAAVEEWGVARALERFNGMFAFALWDRQDRVLYLARDRMGEKPIYYGWFSGTFLFGSEIKALRAHPAFEARIDRDALALFMRHGYVPTPYSIHVGLRKLVPAGLLVISPVRPGEASLSRYWSPAQVAASALGTPFTGSADEAVEQLESLLHDAVKLRMQSDVPLGAFLSGGIDSSTIVALMQTHSAQPVRTFTIGFREDRYNEAEHAKKVAHHLGTHHTELYLGARDALEVIPRLPLLYDEPFADSSQIPTLLVSELTRRHVTVSLSGDGGDELFCGYPRYSKGVAIWNRIRWVPAGLRARLARGIEALPADPLARHLGARGKRWAQRLDARSVLLRAETPHALYRKLVSLWQRPTLLVPGSSEPPTPLTDRGEWPAFPTLLEWMMYVDALTYLPDDILTKVDRASMGVSLEARVPLLDHRVVELAWRFPQELKVRHGMSKWALRQVLYRYVPSGLIDRPKMGFAVPIDAWLSGPLRPWATDLLSETRLRRDGYLDAAVVRDALREHLSGRRNRASELWNVLMFQAWMTRYAAEAPSHDLASEASTEPVATARGQ